MQLIVITSADAVAHEAAIINNLFAAGLMRLHLRKPGSSAVEVGRLLNRIDAAFYERIALHQHHELAPAYGITRLHYTEQARLQSNAQVLESRKQDGYVLSTSVHDVQLLPLLSAFDYAFFGPVFNSLSKPGYASSLSPDFQLNSRATATRVIAIGGIEPSRMPTLQAMRFDGAAVLGAIWNRPENAIATFKQLRANMPVQQPHL